MVPSIGIGDGGEVMEVCRFSWCLFMKFKDIKRCFGKILDRFVLLKDFEGDNVF